MLFAALGKPEPLISTATRRKVDLRHGLKPAFCGPRLRLPQFWAVWLRLRGFQRLRLCDLSLAFSLQQMFQIIHHNIGYLIAGFGFEHKASASKTKWLKASSSVKASALASEPPGFGPCLVDLDPDL